MLKQEEVRDGEMKVEKCSSTLYDIICTIYKLCIFIWIMLRFIHNTIPPPMISSRCGGSMKASQSDECVGSKPMD